MGKLMSRNVRRSLLPLFPLELKGKMPSQPAMPTLLEFQHHDFGIRAQTQWRSPRAGAA